VADIEPLFNQKDISDANGPVDTKLDGGVVKLETNATIQVSELLGKFVFPCTWLSVDSIGATSDTIRVQIPDDSVDVTITQTASEADIELLAEKVADDLNANGTFSALYKAVFPDESNVVCIVALNIFTIRPDVGDVILTPSGTITTTLGFDTIIQREVPLALFAHPDDCRLGTAAITGSVTTTPGTIDEIFLENAESGGSPDLLVDGSSTPVTFTINAPTTSDAIITSLRFHATGTAFKFLQFLSLTTKLTNGVEVKITSNGGKIKILTLIKSTEDFRNLFAIEEGTFDLMQLPSSDNMVADFIQKGAMILKKNSSDKIEIKIQDNLLAGSDAADEFKFLAVGFLD